jgi:hypothetical protein
MMAYQAEPVMAYVQAIHDDRPRCMPGKLAMPGDPVIIGQPGVDLAETATVSLHCGGDMSRSCCGSPPGIAGDSG